MTIERSQNERTHYEVTNGLKVDRGWSSPMFINDHKRDECIMEDVKVLVCDGEIGNILDIESVLKDVINNRERLLIIAPCSLNVVNTLAANVMKNGLKVCNISPPSFGYRQHELMQDIALSVGATYFSEKTGDDLRLIEYSDFIFLKVNASLALCAVLPLPLAFFFNHDIFIPPPFFMPPLFFAVAVNAPGFFTAFCIQFFFLIMS